jgi:hypothetical protein
MASLNALVETIADGDWAGRTFRRTDETPRRVAIIDAIQAVTGMDARQAQNALDYVKKKNPEVTEKISNCQFSGEGQRKTPVTTAAGLVSILRRLNRKYIAKFDNQLDELVVRYLGGDVSLNEEINNIRAAQEQAPADHPMRVFGEAVESGQVGNLVSTITEPAEIADWHDKREFVKEGTKEKSAQVQACFPFANAGVYARTNGHIGYAVTGEYPAQFKKKRQINKNKRTRDFYTRGQLGCVAGMEDMVKNLAGKSANENEFEERVKRLRDAMHDVCKMGDLHGKSLAQPPPAPPAAIAAPTPPPTNLITNYFSCNVTQNHSAK